MPEYVTSWRLFKWGIILLVITVVSRILLDDTLIRLDNYLSPSQPDLAIIFLIVNLVSTLSLALGAGFVSAGLVLRGLESERGTQTPREEQTRGTHEQ